MRKRSVTLAAIMLPTALLVLASGPVSGRHYETCSNRARAPLLHSTICQMKFTLKEWSASDKIAKGNGTITCDNSQKAAVSIYAKGGGLSAGKSQIRDGYGKFSAVDDIFSLFGTYVKGGKGTVMHKGEVSLALSGKGPAFSQFTITFLGPSP